MEINIDNNNIIINTDTNNMGIKNNLYIKNEINDNTEIKSSIIEINNIIENFKIEFIPKFNELRSKINKEKSSDDIKIFISYVKKYRTILQNCDINKNIDYEIKTIIDNIEFIIKDYSSNIEKNLFDIIYEINQALNASPSQNCLASSKIFLIIHIIKLTIQNNIISKCKLNEIINELNRCIYKRNELVNSRERIHGIILYLRPYSIMTSQVMTIQMYQCTNCLKKWRENYCSTLDILTVKECINCKKYNIKPISYKYNKSHNFKNIFNSKKKLNTNKIFQYLCICK